jgi:hypothetical protein
MLRTVDWTQFRDSGDLFLPQPIQDFLQTHLIGTPTSLFYITYWSILHLLSGVGTAYVLQGYFRLQWLSAVFIGFLIHTAWEAWQVLITRTLNTQRGKVDTIVDTVLFLTGFLMVSLFL